MIMMLITCEKKKSLAFEGQKQGFFRSYQQRYFFFFLFRWAS